MPSLSSGLETSSPPVHRRLRDKALGQGDKPLHCWPQSPPTHRQQRTGGRLHTGFWIFLQGWRRRGRPGGGQRRSSSAGGRWVLRRPAATGPIGTGLGQCGPSPAGLGGGSIIRFAAQIPWLGDGASLPIPPPEQPCTHLLEILQGEAWVCRAGDAPTPPRLAPKGRGGCCCCAPRTSASPGVPGAPGRPERCHHSAGMPPV